MRRSIVGFLRELSPRTEFIIVLVVAFGLPVAGSFTSLFHSASDHPHHTNASLIFLQIYEMAVLALLCSFLYIRGWSFRRVGLVPSLKDSGIGIVLFAAAYGSYVVAWWITVLFFPPAAQMAVNTQIVGHGIWLANAVTVSMINPLFEELFVTGYVITALKGRDAIWFGTNVSVGIRLLYHLYQGPLGVISVIPMGLIFAQWFARTGRLWPVVVAHALGDFLPLLALIQS